MRGYRLLRGTWGATGLGEEDWGRRTLDAASSSAPGHRPGERTPETGEASCGENPLGLQGKSGRETGWDRPFVSADLEKTVPGVGVGGASRCQLARLTQVPQIRAWRSLGDIGGSPRTVRSTPGSRDPRPGDRGPAPLGPRGQGTRGRDPGGSGARGGLGAGQRGHMAADRSPGSADLPRSSP